MEFSCRGARGRALSCCVVTAHLVAEEATECGEESNLGALEEVVHQR